MARKKNSAAAAAAAQKAEARDAVKRAVVRDRFSVSIDEQVIKLLRRLEADIVRRLSDFDPGDTNRRAQRLAKLKKEVAEEIAERYQRVADVANGDLTELAHDEAKWKRDSLNRIWNSVGISADPTLASSAMLDALADQHIVLGGVAADFWSAEGDALAAKFAQQMQIGVAGGEDIGGLIKRVRGSKAAGLKDGIMAVSRRNAESLVRTSVNSVANAAHLAVYEANTDVIEALQHYSVLDSRTTIICSARHGLKWRADTLEPIGHSVTFQRPPLHWRCRSIISAIVDLKADPALPTFSEWFDSLNPAEQDSLFGVGRSQLWREGRIDQSTLLNQAGRPLTFEELKAQHGAPARKAIFSNRADFIADPDTSKAASMLGVGPERLTDLAEDMLGDKGRSLAGDVKASVFLERGGDFTLQIEGGPIENMQRRFSKAADSSIDVYHAFLAVDAKSQGSGLGASIMRGSRETYRALGVRKITVTANIDVGGYTWARFGFAANDPAAFASNMLTRARTMLRKRELTDADFADIEDLLTRTDDEWRIPYDLAGLLGANGEKIGKKLLLGTIWRGHIDLTSSEHAALFDLAIGK